MSDIPLRYIKGIGEKREELLHKLGIYSLSELVHFFPRTYLDFTALTPISQMIPGETYAFSAIVGYPPVENKIRTGMVIYKTMVTDGTAGVRINIFNSKYLADSLEQGEEYIFYGKVTASNGSFEMSNPLVIPYDKEAGLRPVYPLTAGLSSNILQKIIDNALEAYFKDDILLPVPEKIRAEYSLAHKQFALRNIHFPKSRNDLEISKKSLIFEELLVFQTAMLRLKNRNKGKTSLSLKNDFTDEFMTQLPFTLTSAQQRVIGECIADMKTETPMNRLVQGDVGSGKTVVAACLIHTAAKNKIQSVLMAPTEILARQHFATLKNLIKDEDITCELLTGSVTAKKKADIKERLKNGEIDYIVGTHALLTDNTEFQNLGLVITDEQHRFGVRQRGTLTGKGNNPHTLVMSATPIPRTLSLIIYGDLDVSVIDELPKGRQKISTFAVDSSYRQRMYGFIKDNINKGNQAYIVCPAVEENEGDIASAVSHAEELAEKEFRDFKVGLLHGKMKAKDKEKVMADFQKGDIQLLVSTTVIEVGVDVPNSTVMVIENAERFGLSQLHQLRGRVGRGKDKSYCILVSDAKGETAKARLDIMCKTNNGFTIADKDLELRGPGEFFGSKQHGLPEMKIASFTENMDTVRQTHMAAKKILADDPKLTKPENSGLKAATKNLLIKQAENKLSFN